MKQVFFHESFKNNQWKFVLKWTSLDRSNNAAELIKIDGKQPNLVTCF